MWQETHAKLQAALAAAQAHIARLESDAQAHMKSEAQAHIARLESELQAALAELQAQRARLEAEAHSARLEYSARLEEERADEKKAWQATLVNLQVVSIRQHTWHTSAYASIRLPLYMHTYRSRPLW